MRARLLIAGQDDPDMRYATGLLIGDPFIWVRLGEGKRAREYVIVSGLEYGRAKRCAKAGTGVILLDQIGMRSGMEKARKPMGRKPNLADVAARFLASHNITEVLIAENAWAVHLEALREHGLRPRIVAPYFPERAIKSPQEIGAIRRTGLVAKKAFRHCVGILRAASIERNGALRHEGRPLTSEFLKNEIERIFLAHGCASGETIVACGKAASQPHNTGSGLLRAGEPIVLDIFPRDLKSGYYFDMTRTVVKGAPKPGLRRLYDAVRKAQLAGLAAVKAGRKVSDIDAACRGEFERLGYKTAADEGFIHSTGHGLGLAIHEVPRLGAKSNETLAAGMVITIESGLYYKNLGGVRIEDTIVVTPQGHANLTGLPRTIVLK